MSTNHVANSIKYYSNAWSKNVNFYGTYTRVHSHTNTHIHTLACTKHKIRCSQLYTYMHNYMHTHKNKNTTVTLANPLQRIPWT